MFWRKCFIVLLLAFFIIPKQVSAEVDNSKKNACINLGCPDQSECSAFASSGEKNAEGNYYCLSTKCQNEDNCVFVDRKCNTDDDCTGYSTQEGGQKCLQNYCYLDASGKENYDKGGTVGFTDVKVDLRIKEPKLMISIPGLIFSKLSSSTITKEGSDTYLNIPYIGEYIAAAYKVGLVIMSIIAVVMIVVTGVKIIVGGGDGKAEGFRRIGQVMVGLFIGWGSFTILNIVNPNLVKFQALKVQYIQGQEILFGDDTTNDSADNTGDVGFTENFSECPVQMSSGPVTKIGKNNKTVPDAVGNKPRKEEFVQKMLDNKILTGDFSNRAMLAAEAASKCKIYFGTCGQGTTAIYALAGVNGSFGLNNKCLKQTCNMGGDPTIKKKDVKSVYYTKIGGVGVGKLLQGMLCAGVPVCQGAGWSVNWKEPCFTDKKAASNKLKEMLTATGQWNEEEWFDVLKPGDYYDIANWNTTCSPTHSAMFLGWKDKANHIAFQAGGDAGNFFKLSTHNFNKSGAVIIMIQRPVDK